MQKNKAMLKNNFLGLLAKKVLVMSLISASLISCTKFAGNKNATATTSSGGSTTSGGYTPLPPLAGSGGTSGGTTSGGGTSSGSGTANPNIPQAFVQGLFYTSLSSAYVKVNDSISLKYDGSYTSIYAGSTLFQYKVGTGASSDAVYTSAIYYLYPYSYYTYVVFKSPTASAGETILYNDITAPIAGTAQVRFVSLDPLTTSVPITFKLTNYLDNLFVSNRTYLDNRNDSTKASFKTITPGFSNVSFIYRDSTLLTFAQNFESGKKYTVFAGALSYLASPKGTLPVNYYQVARHN